MARRARTGHGMAEDVVLAAVVEREGSLAGDVVEWSTDGEGE